MRTIILIIFLSILAGCGTVTSVKMDTPQTGKVSFRLIDNRPDEMRKSRTEADSSGVTTFYGDDKISPSVASLVTSALQTGLGNELAGHTVTLNEFVLYAYEHGATVNMRQLNTAAASTPEGYSAEPFAAMLIPGIDKIVGQKTVYLRISGKVDDKEFSTSVGDLYRGSVTESDIQATMKKTFAKLVKDVQLVVDKK